VVTKPELLILDEPVNGLDPVGMHELRNLFVKLSRHYGITLLISSHILGEIEQIADTIGVIRKGKLIKEASMDEIRSEYTNHLELAVEDYPAAAFVLENELNVKNFRVKDEKGLIHIYDNHVSQDAIIQAMVRSQIRIGAISSKQQPLEDYFLQLVEGGNSHA
jgi:ABC-2 type transport system ATP-binding protein